MKKIGITGGIGSGKSTVCELFKKKGVPVYNSDERAKHLGDTVLVDKIKAAFGEDVYKDGVQDRKKLAEIIFSDKEKLKLINSIVIPAVTEDFLEWCKQYVDLDFVLIESAIIYETEMDKILDSIILVYAPEHTRIERVMKRNNVTEEEVLARMKNQMNEYDKVLKADFHIANYDERSLMLQIDKLYTAIKNNEKG